MSTREWTAPSGRTLEVVRHYPGLSAIGVPLADWPKGEPPANAGTPYIKFTDPANPALHWSVPYSSDKPVSQLTDEEIAVFWEQVVAANPELRAESQRKGQ